MQLVEPQKCAKAYNLRKGDKRSIWESQSAADIGELCKNKERKRKVKMARAWILGSVRDRAEEAWQT